jgi:hypothetical protein
MMPWIAQHKALTISIALVVGSTAVAPSLANGDVAEAADQVATHVAQVPDAVLSLGGLRTATAGPIEAGPVSVAPQYDLRRVTTVRAGDDTAGADARIGAQATDEQVHLNTNLTGKGALGGTTAGQGSHAYYEENTQPRADGTLAVGPTGVATGVDSRALVDSH